MSSPQWPGRALECVQYLCVSVELAEVSSNSSGALKRSASQCIYWTILFYFCCSSFRARTFNICYSAGGIFVVCWFSSLICSLLSLSLSVESGGGVGAVYLLYQWWSNEQAAGARAVLQLPLRLVLCICCQLLPAQRGQRMKFQSKISE